MSVLYKNLPAVILAVLAGFSAFAQERLKTDREMPILAWIGVPEKETTVERFLELKASGININFSGYSSIEAVEKALDIAQQTGVKLLPSCPASIPAGIFIMRQLGSTVNVPMCMIA